MLLRLVLLLAVLYFRTPTATCCVDSLDGAVFECPVMLNLTPVVDVLGLEGGRL